MAREIIDLNNVLDRFGRDTVDKIVDKINAVGAVRTGMLRDSIDFKVEYRDGEYSINFEMVDYGKFVDEGTRYIEPREFFVKVIEDEAERFLESIVEKEIEEQVARALGFR